MEVNMVAVMEVDKVADMVAYMAADKEEKEKITDLSWRWWPTRRWTR